MKDYSKEIDALNFLKRYLLIENQIEKKYAPDEIRHCPRNEHNIDMLNRKLERQLREINEKHLPYLKIRFRSELNFLIFVLLNGTLIFPKSIVEAYRNEQYFVAVLETLVAVSGIAFGLKWTARASLKLQDVKDMNVVNDQLHNFVIDEETKNLLSTSAQESLQVENRVTLNNIQDFTHKDIQKIKKVANMKTIK